MSPRHWRPSPLLQASALVHGGAVLATAASPALWPWAVGAVVANHAVLTTAGLLPRCNWLGPTLTRLPDTTTSRGEVALTLDDGPDPELTPRVLDLLDAAGARASFFLIGERAQAHPALCREIVQRGHRIENHSHGHRHHFSLYGPRAMARDVAAAQDVLEALSGRRPHYFRAPAGLRNPFLEPVLAREGLLLAAWTRRAYDTRCGDTATVLARLTRDLAAGDILLLHDHHSATDGQGRPVILSALPALLATLAERCLQAVPLPDRL